MRLVALGILMVAMLSLVSLIGLGVYVPSPPTPPVYVTKSYVVSMNLAHSEPPLSYVESLRLSEPLTYSELVSEENATAPWIGVANLSFTLVITNATPTPYPIVLKSISSSNSTGGVRWILNVTYPLNGGLQNPLTLEARWFVLITTPINGLNYTVYAFETGYETLGEVLGNLTVPGGYLLMYNGYRYSLWHHYLYEGSLYYVVPLPGVVTFYAWFGNDLNTNSRVMPLPPEVNEQGEFPSYLRYFTVELNQYVNYTTVYSATAGVNYVLGNETDYGYDIFGVPRLAPLGPLTYYTPLILYPNGTLINPSCMPLSYGLSVVFQFENPAYGTFTPITLFNETSQATGLTLINGSLLLGGFLISYDFYNLTKILATPLNGLLTQGVNYAGCEIQVGNLDVPTKLFNESLVKDNVQGGSTKGVTVHVLFMAWLLRLLKLINIARVLLS
ncbi:MAG: hypothetical protein RXO25_04540 [Caldivirga sp.]